MQNVIEKLLSLIGIHPKYTALLCSIVLVVWIPDVHQSLHSAFQPLVNLLKGHSVPVVMSLLSIALFFLLQYLRVNYSKNPKIRCPSCKQYTFEPLPIEGKGLSFNLNKKQSDKRCLSCGYCATVTHNKPIK